MSRYAASTVSVHRRTGSFAGLVLPTWGWYSRPSHQCDVAAPWEGGLAALGRKAECGGETSRGSKTAATALSFPLLAIQLPPTFPRGHPTLGPGGPATWATVGGGVPVSGVAPQTSRQHPQRPSPFSQPGGGWQPRRQPVALGDNTGGPNRRRRAAPGGVNTFTELDGEAVCVLKGERDRGGTGVTGSGTGATGQGATGPDQQRQRMADMMAGIRE